MDESEEEISTKAALIAEEEEERRSQEEEEDEVQEEDEDVWSPAASRSPAMGRSLNIAAEEEHESILQQEVRPQEKKLLNSSDSGLVLRKRWAPTHHRVLLFSGYLYCAQPTSLSFRMESFLCRKK